MATLIKYFFLLLFAGALMDMSFSVYRHSQENRVYTISRDSLLAYSKPKEQKKIVKPTNKEIPARLVNAVAYVESGNRTFAENGEVKKRFEPHLFRKISRKHGKRYHSVKSYKKAINVNWKYAAYSTSYGRFQILGMNYPLCGCPTLKDFLTKVKAGGNTEKTLFVKFIKNRKLDKPLVHKNFKKFARGYNGPNYKKNKYDTKLAIAYSKQK